MGEPRRPGLLETILALVSTGAMAWMVMPPQERLWVKLSALAKARQMLGRAAWLTGHRGMGDELAERDYQRYQIAYWLSLSRDWLDARLEEMKP